MIWSVALYELENTRTAMFEVLEDERQFLDALATAEPEAVAALVSDQGVKLMRQRRRIHDAFSRRWWE